MQRHTIAASGTTFEVISQFKLTVELPEEDGCPVIVVDRRGWAEWYVVKKVVGINSSHILRKRCLREMKLMRKFRTYPQIAWLKAPDITYGPDGDIRDVYLYRTLPYVRPGDTKEQLGRTTFLDKIIHKEPFPKPHRATADWEQQKCAFRILGGLHYIHTAGVIHCDIRPGSIFIAHNSEAKISSFGLAREYKPDGANNRGISASKQGFVTVDDKTLWYRAPEFMLGLENCTPAADVWSVGCILAEHLTRKPLFSGKDYLDQLKKIIRLLGKPPDSVFRSIGSSHVRDYVRSLPDAPKRPLSEVLFGVDPLGVELIERMLDLDPTTRITCKDALNHPYFTFTSKPRINEDPISPMSFSFEDEYTAEGLKRLIAEEVRSFHERFASELLEWRKKDWVNEFRDVFRSKTPSGDRGSTPQPTDQTVLYPPVLESDIGFGTEAGLNPRFKLDNPREELETAIANIVLYVPQSEVESFLQQLHAIHERIGKAEQRMIIYKQSLRQLITLCDIYSSANPVQSTSTDRTNAEITSVLKWFKSIRRWLESNVSLDPISVVMKYVGIESDLLSTFSQCPWPVREAYFNSLGAVADPPSVTFSEVLDGMRVIAADPVLVERAALLNGAEAEAFVDILDRVLNIVDSSDRLRRKTFDLLRRICGVNHIIPKSFTLHSDTIQLLSDRPEASGGFADVWRGMYNGRTVAFKVFRAYRLEEASGDQAELKDVFQEAVVWKRLQHPNIAPLYGIDETTFPSQVALVSDWMPHGTVASYLNENTAANRVKLALEIASGLQYLHEMNIIHGDMKSANVLINAHRAACISDFGLAALAYSSKLVTVSVQAGSTRWMAPELLDPEQFGLVRAELSTQSDVFALGMILWELFTGRIPYYHLQKDAQVMSNILRAIRPKRPAQAGPLGLDDDIWALTEACWADNLQERPPMTAVIVRLKDALARFGDAETLDPPPVWPLTVD
ncbi:hypothetical protein CERSUDRAFT_118131 [Gelatoporia subvermispora B]|uniref:Protein kinase domain-containing protein n=1 Tax=Ceriporiopsis subvermispora (strain B) TaxID=914234 RepID=M2R4C7_CERS8|nr:hypothetical protein CERSUDRAFT_118131 [Gelatoporia subvermispora B]